MRSCDHHSHVAVQPPYSKRKRRYRHQLRIYIYMYDVCTHDACRCFCKYPGIVPAVIAYGDARFAELIIHVVCKALRDFSYDAYVHAVCPRTHDATQPGCAELKISVERFIYILGVLFHCLEFISEAFRHLFVFYPLIEFFFYFSHAEYPFHFFCFIF